MSRPWLAYQALQILQQGGIIAYPTEAVYGLGVGPENSAAVHRLQLLKRRSIGKGLILVAADIDQIIHYIQPDDGIDWTAVRASWPGPVTWVFPASRQVPAWVRGRHSSIAVRVSAHPCIQQLCQRTGPIVSTSANPDNRPPARSAMKVRHYFGKELDLVINAPLGGLNKPTEIRDAISGQVLRAGG